MHIFRRLYWGGFIWIMALFEHRLLGASLFTMVFRAIIFLTRPPAIIPEAQPLQLEVASGNYFKQNGALPRPV